MKKYFAENARFSRPLRPGVLFAGALAAAGWLAISSGARQQASPNEIRVQTDLVNIPASVMDAAGHPVLGLGQGDFQLSEENVPQTIARFEAQTNRPVDIALMVDASASAYKELKFETDAAAHFIAQVVHPDDTLGVFAVTEVVTQLADFSGDVPKLQDAARKISPGAGTSLYDAIVLGSHTLRRRPPGRRRAIVLVTDAGETTSISKFEDARRAAISSEIQLYTVVIRPVKNESGRNTAGEHALITIIQSAGGGIFILDDLTQLDAMFARINDALRTQYLLGYYPHPTPPPGSDRHVHLTVKGGYDMQYRSEYFTAGRFPAR